MNSITAFAAAVSFATMPLQHNVHAIHDTIQLTYNAWAEQNLGTVLKWRLPVPAACITRTPEDHDNGHHDPDAMACHVARPDAKAKPQRHGVLDGSAGAPPEPV